MKMTCKYCGKGFEAIDDRQLRFFLRGHVVGRHPNKMTFEDVRLNDQQYE